MNKWNRERISMLLEAFTTYQTTTLAHHQVIEQLRLICDGGMGHMFDLSICVDQKKISTGQSGFLAFADGVPDKLGLFKRGHDHYIPYSPLAAAVPKTLLENKLDIALNGEIVGERVWKSCELYNDFAIPLDESSGLAIFIKDPSTCRIRWGACVTAPEGKEKQLIRKKPLLRWLAKTVSHGMLRLENWREVTEKMVALEMLVYGSKDALAIVSLPGIHRGAELLACSGALEKALGVDKVANSRNSVLADFLAKCRDAHISCSTPDWKSMDGRTGFLHVLRSKVQNALLVRVKFLNREYVSKSRIYSNAISKGLTRREAEIMVLFADAQGDKDVARTLNISVSTARAHARNIFSKLGVSGRLKALNVVLY